MCGCRSDYNHRSGVLYLQTVERNDTAPCDALSERPAGISRLVNGEIRTAINESLPGGLAYRVELQNAAK